MYLGETDQHHSKILVLVGKPQLLPERILRDSHLALRAGCDLLPKGAMISLKGRMVLEFLIVMNYSTYFDTQNLPSFLEEIPCRKTILPL